MNFLRVVLGLAIAAIGLVVALVMLFLGIAFFKSNGSVVAQVGSVLICALLEAVIILGTFFAFRKVMGPTPNDDDGA